jgi:hypothetical protein
VPFGVAILVRFLAAGVITVDQVEAAARVNGGTPEPESASGESNDEGDDDANDAAAALVESESVASKVLALAPGECRWPEGNLDDPAGFRFCAAPIARGRYCAAHYAKSVIPRLFRPRTPKPRAVSFSTVLRAAPELDALEVDVSDLGFEPSRAEAALMELAG